MTLPLSIAKINLYKEKQAKLTKENWQKGIFNHLFNRQKRTCAHPDCEVTFEVVPSDPKKFCSQSCAARVNNQLFPKRKRTSPRWNKPKRRKRRSKINLPVEEVKRLYYKEGLSTREVGERLGATTSQVTKYMSRVNLPRRSVAETRKLQFLKTPKSFMIKKHLSENEKLLKVAGLMLYWAEGKKRSKYWLDFTNSNPLMTEVFLKSLRTVYNIDESRLRGHVYCYANQNPTTLRSFWSRLTKIPLSQFQKTYIRSDYQATKKDRLPFGVFHIRYCDKRLLEQIKKDIMDCANAL